MADAVDAAASLLADDEASAMLFDVCQLKAVDMALSKKSFVLLGAAGTGKSMVVERIVEVLTERYVLVPVCVCKRCTHARTHACTCIYVCDFIDIGQRLITEDSRRQNMSQWLLRLDGLLARYLLRVCMFLKK